VNVRRLVTLLAVVVVVGGLLGTYLVLKNRKSQSAAPAAESDALQISKLDKEQIQRVVLKSPTEGTTLELQKEEQGWAVVGYPYPVKLSETDVDDLLYTFASLYGETLVEENPKDLGMYGLDPPVTTGTAYLSDGSSVTLLLGNKTPAGNTYYLLRQGDTKVYAVWMNHGTHLHYTVSDLRDKTLPPIDLQGITYFRLSRPGEKTIEIQTGTPSGRQGMYVFGTLYVSQPYRQPRATDSESYSKLLQGLTLDKVDAFVDDSPTDLAAYGLKPPQAELSLRDGEHSLHLLIGKKANDTLVYVKLGDSPAVMTMESYKLETLLSADAFALADKFAFIVNIDTVKRILLQAPGANFDITLSKRTEKKEGQEDQEVLVAKVNGQEVPEDSFRKFYQSILGLFVDAPLDRAVSGDPEVRISYFVEHEGKQEVVMLDFIPYDRDFYALSRDGVTEFVLSRAQVQKMLGDMQKLLSGQEIVL
jgi:hypothetical protein